MKKTIALILTVCTIVSLFVFPASATFRRGVTKVWIPDEPGYRFHTPGLELKIVPDTQYITEADMAEAIRNVEPGIIPVGTVLDASRLLVLEQRYASVPEENLPIEITFSVEEADKCSLCVFYLASGSAVWELVSVSAKGPLVECELPDNGQYAVAWGW